MTNKQFVLSVNPKLEYNGYTIDVTKNGIFIRGDESNYLLCLPISLKYEENMWATCRKIAEYQMLRKLES
jgi:hypothetical protein